MNLHRTGVLNLILAFGFGASAPAETPRLPVQSASGQFSVQAIESRSLPARFDLASDPDLLELDPTLLIVSAERLRQHLCREMGDTSPWQGRILFSLRPAESLEAPARLRAEWQGKGWQYQVSLPNYIQRDRFVRTLVEVNLMEMANRNSAGRTVEIPVWLTEGLTSLLLVSYSIEIILPPPRLQVRGVRTTPWSVEAKSYQPLAQAHAQLQTNAPLSIEQMSWPTPASLLGRKGQTYRSCAQLLVTRLLRLPEGPALLNAFIRNLGRHYNWQVAFLDAYSSQFPTLLDFEKWWALQVAHFTGRELGATYGYGDSVLRLKQAVLFPVEVRFQTDDLPLHGAMRLQTVIEERDLQQQQRAINRTLVELNLLRARIAPELIGLLDDYRLTLESYLRNRNRSGLYVVRGLNRQVALNAVVRRTLQELDQLDAELEALLPAPARVDALVDLPQ
ncbi:MAG: hypothetical protein MUC91_03305 [Verrucomicrobia bacterium]|nr:hypothetical protein [Verrucomicrobiota bacterium]